MIVQVKKTIKSLTLGGISFCPMLGGMVIPVDSGENGVPKLDSLHVRVYRVEPGSQAYKLNITRLMYLKSLSLVGKDGRVAEPFVIGSSNARVVRTAVEQQGDIWRRTDDIPDENTLNMETLMNQVWSVLSTAMIMKKRVQVELLSYK